MPPTTTARTTPSGIKLTDGYQTLIAPAADPNIAFWERTVQPPGMDGGDMIDTTTMHNTTYRTMSPRSLITLTDMSVTAAYDPNIFNEILSILNVETSWTVHFPDGSTYDFFGALRTLEPSENTEGEMPELTITISPTNQDPQTKAEAAPVLTSVSGT